MVASKKITCISLYENTFSNWLSILGPSEPRNLNFTSASTSSLTLQWNEPSSLNGILTNYSLSWKRTDGEGSETSKLLPNDSLSYQISNLNSNKEYEVTISVRKFVG